MTRPKHKTTTRKLLPPVEITELSQLEKLSHGEPIIARIVVRGQPVKLVGRRLKPAETKEVQLLLERCLPPLLPPEKEGEPARYDFRNPKYLEEKEEHRRMARALAIYSAFPVFKQALEKEGGPTDRDRIVRFIEEREIEDDILEELFRLITERIAGVAAHLGFS